MNRFVTHVSLCSAAALCLQLRTQIQKDQAKTKANSFHIGETDTVKRCTGKTGCRRKMRRQPKYTIGAFDENVKGNHRKNCNLPHFSRIFPKAFVGYLKISHLDFDLFKKSLVSSGFHIFHCKINVWSLWYFLVLPH